ncbi:Putative protein in type-1 retrotransposable element R1DM [Araneus ventricosus]|uniref:Retrovirus-related Pol polyprotein from type-1 retrotransposable element R1 n=1 Tax=Araneus ventricosus TaxID=182803 RepID=A0A4Y2MRJ4_ARAVE|nr:Putative protein in type-1 retrotransposable element R1DM [Araneus ventricosus]
MADQGSNLDLTEGVTDKNLPIDTGQNCSTSASDPFEGESPEIKGLLEKAMELETEIQSAIATSKASSTKQTEIRQPLMEIMKIVVQQQVMIGHLMGRLSTESKERPPSYAQMVATPSIPPSKKRDRSRSRARKLHNIMIYPKTEGATSDQTRKKIQYRIIPSNINVKVNSVKNIGKGGIIINSPTSEDIEKLLAEFQQIEEIRDGFQAFKPKLKDPSIIIFNVTEDLTNEEIIKGLKSQNEELAEAALTVRTSFKGRYRKNWIISMNPEAFNAVIKKPKIVLNSTRLSFKENYKIIQCFKCGKYGHILLKCRDEDTREGGGLCLRCGTKGHKEKECTSNPSASIVSHTILNSKRRLIPSIRHVHSIVLSLLAERTIVAIEVDTVNETFILISVYCLPSANFETDLAALQTVILNNIHKKVLIFGDFNAKSPIWGKRASDTRGQKLTDFIYNNDLYVINKPDSLPTFNGPQGVSWIDLALSLNIHPDRIQNWSITDRLTLSDHNIMEFSVTESTQSKIKKTGKWKLSEINYWKFKELLNIFFKKVFEVEGDLDRLIEQIQQGLMSICYKSRKIRIHHQQNAVWWNPELETMRSFVRALRRRYQKTYDASERASKHIVFKKNLAIYVNKIALAKENSFRDFLKSIVKTNTFDSFYKLVKRNLNIAGNVQQVITETGELTSSLKESMLVILEHYFPRLETNFFIQQKVIYDNPLIFPEVTELEIEKIFTTSSMDKAPGPDGLTLGIIKEVFVSNKDLFINIMNSSLRRGNFPSSWKEAKVVLIPKEGKDLQRVTSYRPICLLSTWGKILDKLITMRLQYELEANGKLSYNRFGFRKDKSTLSALGEFTNYIRQAKEEKMITIAVTFDISNAFNSIHWNDIISCVHEDNISNYLFKIIESFLSGRKIVDHDFNISFFYNRGVPQGSSLGPILWLLIAERLLRAMDPLRDVKLIIFTDDILLLSKESVSYIFSDKLKLPLDTIEKWAQRTVSSEALNILTGCPPLDIIAKLRREKYDLLHRNRDLVSHDIILNREDLDLMKFNFHPPWMAFTNSWTMDKDPDIKEYKIFTDGSKLNEQVGCGAICYDNFDQEQWSFSIRLSNNASVFIAEAFAILESIKKIMHLGQDFYIFTDSRSVLMALASCRDQTTIIEDIRSILKDSTNIKLCWIKAHVGISGSRSTGQGGY